MLLGKYLLGSAALVAVLFAGGVANAACTQTPPISRDPTTGSPFATRDVTRMDTQTSDNVSITGGCADLGTLNDQIYNARTYKDPTTGRRCTWDATHDVARCINAAIAAANAAGGGTVMVPAGSFGQSTAVVLLEKVKVVGAGGANFQKCGTSLTAITAMNDAVTGGSDSSASNVVDTGISGFCMFGAGIVSNGVKLRSVVWGTFRDIYQYGYTGDFWNVDISSTALAQSAFNHYTRIYSDLTSAASVNANGWNVGAQLGTLSNEDVNRQDWNDIVVNGYQSGKGFICGFMDSSVMRNAHIEGGSTASLYLSGGTTALTRVCQNNYFQGEFGANLQGAPVSENNTYIPYGNVIDQNRSSGAPKPLVNSVPTTDSPNPLTWYDKTFGAQYTMAPLRNITVASFNVLYSELGTTYTNTGSAISNNAVLPPAAVGLHYCFLEDTRQWTITPDGTDQIAVGSINGSAGGTVVLGGQFSSICIKGLKTGQWVATSAVGPLTVN